MGQGNYDGHLTATATGTVLKKGKTCTTISGGWSGTWNWPVPQPITGGNHIDTFFADSVLYGYEPISGNFDTIMDYKAKIGDSWYVSGWDSICFEPQPIKMTVTDTGHIQINAVNLRTFTVSGYQIIERMANTICFFNPVYLCYMDVIDARGAFYCYKDNEIGLYSKTGECNFVGLHEARSNTSATLLFPNPSQGIFSANLASAGMIKVFASDGTNVLNEQRGTGEQTLDLRSLPDGIYFVQIGQNNPLKICKTSESR